MKFIFTLVLLLILTSCAAPLRGVEVNPRNYNSLRGWNEQNIKYGMNAFRKTCSVINSSKVQSNAIFSQNRTIWNDKCNKSKYAVSGKQFFEQNFIPYQVVNNGNPTGIFTGYFEKEIEASLRKDTIYKYPIYRMPSQPGLLNLSRREIENGALRGKGLEFAYAKSAARLFFLHIQGSGILKLPDGRRMEVGFAGKNNHPYRGIGSYMLSEGMIKHGSAEEIISYLERYPVSGRSVMNMNDRYVFFEPKNGGPYGSMGIELTDQASLAVDPVYMPMGIPLWLQTTLPVSRQPFTRLMVAQDTGSAIKGPIRGDIFFGEGEWARVTASGMKNAGSYYILVPRGINARNYF